MSLGKDLTLLRNCPKLGTLKNGSWIIAYADGVWETLRYLKAGTRVLVQREPDMMLYQKALLEMSTPMAQLAAVAKSKDTYDVIGEDGLYEIIHEDPEGGFGTRKTRYNQIDPQQLVLWYAAPEVAGSNEFEPEPAQQANEETKTEERK